eukprot:1160786-Pelagomonas_calceolata.AAC.3
MKDKKYETVQHPPSQSWDEAREINFQDNHEETTPKTLQTEGKAPPFPQAPARCQELVTP